MKRSICLIFIIIAAIFQPCFGQLAIKEGKDAVYIYLANRRFSPEVPMESIIGANLYRAVGNEPFKELEKIQPATTIEAFKRIAGADVLSELKQEKQLKTEQDAWLYIQSHPMLSDYGLMVLNPDFSVAMGAVYKDVDALKPDVKTVRYKVEYLSKDAKSMAVEGQITLGIPPVIAKPIIAKVEEKDSSITISWKSKLDISPDVFLAQVWVRERANAPYKMAGHTMAQRNEKTSDLSFTWSQHVKPALSYGFYITPLTLLQRPGPSSDTTALISKSFKNLYQISIATVKDSSGGIFISWKMPKDVDFYSGIVVERSKEPSSGFAAIDTIPGRAVTYIDRRVLPNVLYHYRFRVLTMRGNLSEPSAYTSHRILSKKRIVEATESIKLSSDALGNSVISWRRVKSPEVSGYQVFRSLQGDSSFEPISNLVQDSSFVDTTVHNSRITYKYAVKTFNYDEQSSDFSTPVFGRPNKAILPVSPYDVEGYAEPGKVTLRWKDMTSYDTYIRGYTVYRKPLGAGAKLKDTESTIQELLADGFKKLNQQPVEEVVFVDRTALQGINYAYAVTATDQYGVEGKALGSKKMEVPRITLRAPEIYVRATSKGIEINWEDVLVPGIEKYMLYVRTPAQTKPILLAEVPPGRGVYVNQNVKAGERYFFTLQIKGKGMQSPLGMEKSVRKD